MSSAEKKVNKVCLIVIDGWGIAPESPTNAVTVAKPENMTRLQSQENLAATMDASGLAVGLPEGNMGNSEVGHLTIGAGRVNFQDLERINQAIKEDTLRTNPDLVKLLERAKSTTGTLHFMGLVSDGGVHSHMNHLKELLKIAKAAGVPRTFVHAFADGRDTAPKSAAGYITDMIQFMEGLGYGQLVTVVGRYYAMDRDRRWERIEIAYNSLVGNPSEAARATQTYVAPSAIVETIRAKYEANESDEFLKPIVAVDASNQPIGRVQDGDTILFFNFRSDRMRQINSVFGMNQFPFAKYDDEGKSDVLQRRDLYVAQFTQYDASFTMPVLFKPLNMRDGLAELVSKAGLRQYHVAETEKYAHVTFFFNGGIEAAFDKEDRELIPSPKVATYDLLPSMSAMAVADAMVAALGRKSETNPDESRYAFAMCNFAPPDMVGHTGVLDAAVTAVQTTDSAIGKIAKACQENDYTLIITADHGNAEKMVNEETGAPHTAHTSNPVPFVIQLAPSLAQSEEARQHFGKIRAHGELADVAPTVLELMGIQPSPEMTGKSMFVH